MGKGVKKDVNMFTIRARGDAVNIERLRKMEPPLLKGVFEALAGQGMTVSDIGKLVEKGSLPTVRKLLCGQISAYDEDGKPTNLANEVSGILVEKVEDLFGPSPNSPENACNNVLDCE